MTKYQRIRAAIIRELQRSCCIQTNPNDDTSFRVASHDEAVAIADGVPLTPFATEAELAALRGGAR